MTRILQLVRHRSLQPIWQRAHSIVIIAMNFWASQFASSGERDALAYAVRSRPPQSTPIILDVGANLGEFTEYCIETFGDACRIHAFEPASSTHSELSRRILTLGGNIEAHRIGISDESGQAVLHTSEPCSTIASLVDIERPIRPFDPALDEKVDITTIDEFCASRSIDRIYFLKLDIEGHELAALEGARNLLDAGRIDCIQFEFGENNVSSRTFLDDFDKLLTNYNLYRVVPGGPVPWSYRGGVSEIFATMNYLAILRDGEYGHALSRC